MFGGVTVLCTGRKKKITEVLRPQRNPAGSGKAVGRAGIGSPGSFGDNRVPSSLFVTWAVFDVLE